MPSFPSVLLSAVLIASLAIPGGAAAVPGDAAARATFAVVVKDKKGAPVPDLQPAELEVTENGSKRPVESLRYVPAAAPAEGSSDPGLLVSLVFDGMGPDQHKLAKKAVEDLLARPLGPNTWIGVFRIGLQLWTVQPFTRDLALVRQGVEKAASNLDATLAEPDGAARREVGEELALLAAGKAKDPAAVSRAEALGKIMRHGDRLLRQQQQGSPLYLLMAVAKGQASAPGRKAVVYFTGGLAVPEQIAEVYRATISEANRAGVAFYSIDVGGLGTWSEAMSARDNLEGVAAASRDASGSTSGATSVGEVELTDRTVDSTRGNWKQPLKELAESTGGFAALDTNDYKKHMERLTGDLAGHYEVTYAPASPTWDGAARKVEFKTTRGGAKAQGPTSYVATPPDDTGPILAYELPLLEALKSPEARKDLPMASGVFRFAPGPEGRGHVLVAEIPMSTLTFAEDPKQKLYKLHFALLAVVKDGDGKVVERVSQDYPLQGPLDKLPQLKQGNVVFKRVLVVPPGTYTIELVARDRDSGATTVHRAPLEVPAAQDLAVSSVVIVRRMEPAPPPRPGAPEDPLRGEAMRIVPSLDDPISKAATTKMPVYLVVYPAAAGGPPQMTVEFRSEGKAEGRSNVALPAPDPDGRIRFLAPIPIDRFAPGRHEMAVTVRQGPAQAEARVGFTLVP
jgi:VWFA-related protein